MIENWIIAGATGGLGSAIARELADKGCNLTILGSPLSKKLLMENVRDLEIRSGNPVKSGIVDVSIPGTFKAMFDKLELDGRPLGVIWSIGVLWPQGELERDPIRASIAHQINYTAAIEFLELAAAHMKASDCGHIVALGSPAGDRGRRSNYLYGASKAALHTHLEGLRHRFAKSAIVVTCVKPGPTRTPMTAGMTQRLQADPKLQARRIVSGIQRGRQVVYAPSIWWPVMKIVRHLPNLIYDKLDL
ncbi:MAG TPA: SDR family NAD(P)-dependent oxidoreductase [Bacteroidetes bacterium]|nr:putative oxidoreductase [bacterium BMS3Bbin04]HDO65423.1 SDR family NAD(P)-dependent oxidoreductase [Bacteroidota bacterium]HEX04548.1 SDR family NAD(P)-dependent oxidoreductase [Bacteroidota bacterium]